MFDGLKKAIISLFFIMMVQSVEAAQDDPLTAGAKSYIKFMQTVGESNDEDTYLKEVPNLFTSNCKKVECCRVLFENNAGFEKQLRDARTYVGTWKINILSIHPCIQNHTCIVHFQWSSSVVPLHTTMAILTFAPTMQISEIQEVYNVVKGSDFGAEN